jgi:cytochrome P450
VGRCAGRRFAEQDMRVALVRLVQHFQISYTGELPMRQRYQSLLVPDNLGQFEFVPRRQS